MQTATETPTRRPVWVWLISVYFFLSASWTLLSFYLIRIGAVPLTPPQRSYFESLNGADYLLTIIGALLTLSAAVSLFLLSKSAYYLFCATLAFNIAYTLWHIISRHWISVIGVAGLAGAGIGSLIMFVICLYTARLMAQGKLK